MFQQTTGYIFTRRSGRLRRVFLTTTSGRLQSCLWPREVDIFQGEVWTSPAVSVETRAGILSNNRTFVSVIELDTLEEISGQFQVESVVTKAGYFAEKLRQVFLN